MILLIITYLLLFSSALGEHHFKRFPPEVGPLLHLKLRQNNGGAPLVITNQCADDIYPGIDTQSGNGPSNSGFKLSHGDSYNQTVSSSWQGRVWGRTNCSFNAQGTGNGGGQACSTGDCGALQCKGAGNTPVTLAEFTLGANGQTFYDISLVDGYNIPLAIVLLNSGGDNYNSRDGSKTNPSCVATYGLLAPQNWDPYSGGRSFLGTTSSDPLPFDRHVNDSYVDTWCPWDLQVNKPQSPSDSVYNYPDGDISRPAFNPCYSACEKYRDDQDCCQGSHNSPQTCQPSDYSRAAKTVCPDAYSYAYDDQDSTIVVDAGAGFEVIFCPGGRSTTILATGPKKRYVRDFEVRMQKKWSPKRRKANLVDLTSGVWQVLFALVIGFVLAGALLMCSLAL